MKISQAYRDQVETLPAHANNATVELGWAYAIAIDLDPDKLSSLGPKLLAVLDALNLTPKAQSRLGKEVEDAAPELVILDELRARRLGQNGSENRDAASS